MTAFVFQHLIPILLMNFPFELECKRRNELRDYEPSIFKGMLFFRKNSY